MIRGENNEWLKTRGDCISYMNNILESALKQFTHKVGIKDIFAYDYNSGKNKFIIYTSRPGIWIGYHGNNVKILKEILSKEIKEGCDVEFKEIRSKFIVAD